MEMLKVFTQGIFGIKNAERKFYGFIIQEFQSILNGYKDEISNHLNEVNSLTETIKDLNAENAKLKELYQKATRSLNDLYIRIVPKLSDVQLYELSEIIDPEGWILLYLVKELTNTNTNDLHYEDNIGTFECLDGNQLIWWHERMAFAEAEYHLVPGTCYEKTVFKELNKTTKEYMEYKKNRTDNLRKYLANISLDSRNIDPELFNDGLMYLLHTISI